MSKISLNDSEYTGSTFSLTTDDILSCYYEAFHTFRKHKSSISPNDLLGAMRCAGANPTEQELQDIKNTLDDGSGEIIFNDFCKVMSRIDRENDEETLYKETFRTFSKDSDGCIPSQEMKFVFEHLGVGDMIFKFYDLKKVIQMEDEEIDQMMDTIDRNGDGKVSYTEFRVMLGANPLIHF